MSLERELEEGTEGRERDEGGEEGEKDTVSDVWRGGREGCSEQMEGGGRGRGEGGGGRGGGGGGGGREGERDAFSEQRK